MFKITHHAIKMFYDQKQLQRKFIHITILIKSSRTSLGSQLIFYMHVDSTSTMLS